MASAPPSVAFLHPDLGIGGAERLVVDAALALKATHHKVHMFTSHHDPSHCFQETRDGTLQVTVYGDWLPRSIFGFGFAFCAYLRMVYLALCVLIASAWTGNHFDVFFVDQVSVCVPWLRTFSRSPVVFYCHFPDQLLTQRPTALKRLYRAPLDFMEEVTTGMANVVLVNSKFTAGVFRDTFKRLTKTKPAVLYPSLNFSAFDKSVSVGMDSLLPKCKSDSIVFLSINRYERKKNLLLAVQALVELKSLIGSSALWQRVHLVMAGGYDHRVEENVSYHRELEEFTEKAGVASHVTFLRSFSDDEKIALLARCRCLLYTPSNEHFGITPLEAMYCKRSVIAVNSGGPLETVATAGPGATGFLCEPLARPFAESMKTLLEDQALATRLGEQGKKRVVSLFSFPQFTEQVSSVVDNAVLPTTKM